MKKTTFFTAVPLVLLIGSLFFSAEAIAGIDSQNIFNNVLAEYKAAASGWKDEIEKHASWLFWSLASISIIWTFGFMALRKADISEFFAEFIRFIIFTGFFWWLLQNGSEFAEAIILSLRKVGEDAAGIKNGLTPSHIVDMGFDIFYKAVAQSTIASPMASLVGLLIALAVLVIMTLIGVNMLVLITSGWILAYAGIFFLGFGGSRWTSDMAINYYKTVLGIGASLFTMVLIVGIGKTFLGRYYAGMSAKEIEIPEMAVMLVVAIVLLNLVNKVPSLVAGIITGSSMGGASGMGGFGAGAAMGAASMAGAALSMGASMAGSTAASVAGGTQAIIAAASKAYEDTASGNMSSKLGGNAETASDGGSGASLLASAMGKSSEGSASFTGASTTHQTSSKGEESKNSTDAVTNSASNGSGNNAEGNTTSSASDSKGEESKNSGQENTNHHQNAGTHDMSPPPSSQSTPKQSGDSSKNASSKTSGDQNTSKESPQKSSQTPSVLKSVASSAKTAAKFAGHLGANLAKGAYAVGKEKIDTTIQSAKDRIGQTTGGRIAEAIHASRSDPQNPVFENNNLSTSNEKSVDAAAEIAAFCDRKGDQ